MPQITIDGRAVEAAPGTTVLAAARALGIPIPALCLEIGYEPATSCMACLVRVDGAAALAPSCALVVREGMRIESETDEVRGVRRLALELLLSDHVGDCFAPCQLACPAQMEIPLMLRQVAAGDPAAALATVRRDIPLPGVLGRICPEVCEAACRRGVLDHPAAICRVKRFAADQENAGPASDAAARAPATGARGAPTGRRVAVVGAGPAGLAAAWFIAQAGHACTVFDAGDRPGGALRTAIPAERLPPTVLEREVGLIAAAGVSFVNGVRLGRELSLTELACGFSGVFLALGPTEPAELDRLGVPHDGGRARVALATLATPLPGVFAGGDLVRRRRLAIRAVADGKLAAHSLGQHLAGGPVAAPVRPFSSHAGRLDPAAARAMAGTGWSTADRHAPAGGAVEAAAGGVGFDAATARHEALRCLYCDCLRRDDCSLREAAAAYGASQSRHAGTRRALVPLAGGPELVLEVGKCIACGLCVQAAAAAGDRPGLTFLGRGFGVAIGVPFGGSLRAALPRSAAECVRVCPTGALAWREPRR